MPNRYTVPDLPYPHYRILKTTRMRYADGSTAQTSLIDTQFSHTSYTLARKTVGEMTQSFTNRANASRYSLVVSRERAGGADVTLIDDARTEICLRIYDVGRAGKPSPKSVSEPGFGNEEARLGYHADSATPRVNLADTLLQWQKLDAFNMGVPMPRRGFRGSSIDGRVVTMKHKR
jgi:hypothetical protein